jgi:hypothetical protein
MRRSFRTSSCGDYRVQAGASADILRDLRGMGCWRTWQRGDERGPRFALLGRGLRARCYGCVRMTFARGSNHRDLRRDRAGTTSTGTIGCDPELPARAGISSPSELACDQLRPATARQSLCRTRVVGLVSHQPTRLVPGGDGSLASCAKTGLRCCSHREPGIFAEVVSISSTRSAGFGFHPLHQVDRASSYSRFISRCIDGEELLAP